MTRKGEGFIRVTNIASVPIQIGNMQYELASNHFLLEKASLKENEKS